MNSGQANNGVSGSHESVSAALIIGLLKSARMLGVSDERCIKQVGIDDQTLEDPTLRVPYATLISLLDEIDQQSGHRRDIGIELGRQLIPGSFSALGYAAASCKTLGEAIRVIPQYERVILTTGQSVLTVKGDWVLLSWTTTRKPHSVVLEEVILSSWVALARTLTSLDSLQIKVRLTGALPEDCSAFTSLFGHNIKFKQPLASVSFPISLLSIPIIQSDPFINKLMKAQADRIQQSLTYQSVFSHTVAECINQSLAKGVVGQEAIGRQLNVGVRTLRRRLKEEDTNFQTILDAVRRENAKQYLAEKNMSIFEVAMLLGYKDHSAFSAAFKRWFGVTPLVYREGLDNL